MTAATDQTTWAIERQKAYELFGGTSPYDKDDAAIAAAFNQHPAAVIAEIARIADAYANGKVHTPWRALVSRLPKLEQDQRSVTITSDLRLRQAEQWIKNAGLYSPSEADVLDALFHSTGALLAGLEDQFSQRLIALWRAEQPRAQRAQADLETRAERWKAGRESLTGERQGSNYTSPTIPEDAGPPDWDEGDDR